MEEKEIFIEDTLVFLADIQTYSSFVDGSSPKEAIRKTRRLYNMVCSGAETDFGGAKTMRWILSDTIIIVIDTRKLKLCFGSVNIFLHSCAMTFYEALVHCNLPIRGAIGHGYFYYDQTIGKSRFGDGSFLLGSALVDAARWEKQQNWLGAMFSPKAVDVLKKKCSNDEGISILDCSKTKNLCSYGRIPLKNDPNYQGYYLQPMHFGKEAKSWREFLPKGFDDRDGKVTNSDKLYW